MENVTARMWEIYNIPSVGQWESYTGGSGIKADWYQYYKIETISEIGKWIKYINMVYPPKYYQNAQVIDMGCGWGLYSILLKMQGAKLVYALGPDERVDFLSRIVKEIGYENEIITRKVFFDTDTKELVNKKVDLIIGNEFIEHLTDEQRTHFFHISKDTLRENGMLILNTHNTDNRRVLKGVKDHWKKQDDQIYLGHRREIIAYNFSKLDKKMIMRLAKSTYGMNRDGITKVCNTYIENLIIPEPDYQLCAVHPATGIPDENYISPRVIQKEMKDAGFRSKIIPWMGKWLPGRVLQPIANLFPSMFIRYVVKGCVFWGR